MHRLDKCAHRGNHKIFIVWRMRIIDLYQWLTFLRPRSCWLCRCECGAGPQCCLQDWETLSRESREESVTRAERENGGQWVGCSGQPPTHHTALWAKTLGQADNQLFSPKIMIHCGWSCRVVKNLSFYLSPKNWSQDCDVRRGSQLLVGETGLSGESLRRCELDVGLSW